MPQRREPKPIELLELDIDARLTILWEQIAKVIDGGVELPLDFVSALMRAAYAYGYCDALKTPNPQAWLRSHGYLPPRRTTT